MSTFLFATTGNLLDELFENKYLNISQQCVKNNKIPCDLRNMSGILQ